MFCFQECYLQQQQFVLVLKNVLRKTGNVVFIEQSKK